MSYDSNLAAAKDFVRLYLGDTNSSAEIFSDGEIAAVLTEAGNSAIAAAAILAESAAAKFSRSASFSVEGLSIQNVQKAENYRKLAANLRARAASEGHNAAGTPIVTGTSLAEMEAVADNTDRPQDAFRTPGYSYPRT